MSESIEKKTESAATAAPPAKPDPKTIRLVRELKHTRGVLSCRFARDGRRIFAGAQDEFVHVWDLGDLPRVDPALLAKGAKTKSKEPPPPAGPEVPKVDLAGHESWIQAMTLSTDGETLVTGDYVGRVAIWSTRADSKQPRLTIEAHQGSVRAVALSADGKRMASAGNDGLLRLWSTADGKPLQQFAEHGCHVYHTAFHPDGQSIISADLKGVIRHWDLATGKLVRKLDAGPLWTYSEKYTVDVGGVRGMSFNADGTQLACGGAVGDRGIAHSGNPRVLLFDWASGKLLKTFRPDKDVIATVWGVRFHPDGYLIASGGSRTGGFMWFWRDDAETEFHALPFTTRGPGFDLDLDADRKTLAVAHYDGAVRLYEMTVS